MPQIPVISYTNKDTAENLFDNTLFMVDELEIKIIAIYFAVSNVNIFYEENKVGLRIFIGDGMVWNLCPKRQFFWKVI